MPNGVGLDPVFRSRRSYGSTYSEGLGGQHHSSQHHGNEVELSEDMSNDEHHGVKVHGKVSITCHSAAKQCHNALRFHCHVLQGPGHCRKK